MAELYNEASIEAGKIQLKIIGKEIDAATRKMVNDIGYGSKRKLQELVPKKSGNLFRAIYGSPSGDRLNKFADGGVGNFKFTIGFTDTQLNFRSLRSDQVSPLKYVLAQNYGDTTEADMLMNIPFIAGEGGRKSNWPVDNPGEFGEGFKTWTTHRTIPPKDFIKKTQEYARGPLTDLETAQFMRENLK